MARRQVTIFINGKEVANKIKVITAEKNLMVRALNDMVIGTQEYNDKVKEIKKANDIIAKHRQAISGVQGSWDKIAAGATKFLGIAGIAFTVDAVVGYGKELFKAGVQMDALERKSRTVLGPALAFVQQKALDNATAMGLTTQEYVSQAAAIADLLVPMGFQRERAAEIATELVNLSGALSEWTGGQKSAEEVSKILSKALTGEREQLKELGIVIQEADITARLAEKGLDKLTGAMLQQAKAAATLELITEKSADAQTAFAKNADSRIRSVSELMARTKQIGENLAQALVPVFEKLLPIVGSVVDGIARLTGNLADATKENESAVDSVQQLQAEFNNEIAVLKGANLQQDERKKLIDSINTKYGDYLGNLISEKAGLEEIEAAQLRANNAFKQKILLVSFEEELAEISKVAKEYTKLAAAAEKNRARLAAGVVSEGEIFAQDAPMADLRQNLDEIEKGYAKARDSSLAFADSAQQEGDKLKATYDELAKQMGTSMDEIFKRFAQTQTVVPGGTGVDDKAAEKAKKAAEKAAEDEKKQLEKSLQELTEITEKFRQEEQLAQLSEDEQALERIRQKYADEIALAKELEAKGVADATAQRIELERIRDNELSALKVEQANKSLEADLAFEAYKDDLLIEEHLKFLEKKREIEKKIAEVIKTEQEEEEPTTIAEVKEKQDEAIAEANAFYDKLVAEAKAYGVSTVDLEQARADKITEINEEAAEDIADIRKEQAEELAKSFSALASVVGSTMQLIGEDSKEFAALSKLLALAQIGFKTAEAIAAGVAASAGVPFPGNLAAIATTVATVLANIAAATKILNKTQLPQKKFGGYFDVTGADDHQSYRAQYIGSPQSGMLPSHPVVLASEAGPEYFVSNKDLQHPAVANYVRMIDNISRSRVTQFAEGGTAQAGEAVALPATLPAGTENAALTNELRRLNNILERGIFALVDDDEVINIFKKFNSINEASGGTIGG